MLGCSTRLETRLGNGHTLTTAGIVAYHEGDLRGAERLLRSAVVHDYGDTLARFYLARVYLAQGGPEGRMAAETVLGDLSEIAVRAPLYLASLAQLRLGQGYRSNARRALERLLVLEPEDVAARFEVGRLSEGDWWRFQAARDRELAIRFYSGVLDVDPTHRSARTRLAVLSLEADSVEVAGTHIGFLLEHHPDHVETMLLHGVLLEYEDEFAGAEVVFRNALDRLPSLDRGAFEGPRFLEPDSSFAFGSFWAGLDVGSVETDPEGRFWRQRDPTPGTRLNERFVVHASRTAMADFLYGDPAENVRGWETAPGEFYVRYGKPLERTYVAGLAPAWFHTFDVGRRLVRVRFHDYNLSGNFMLPIEFDPTPLHAGLLLRRPENPQLADRLPTAPLPHAAAWFRTAGGEPRLQVAVANTGGALAYEAAVLDSAWREIYSAAHVTEPVTIPHSVPIPAQGLFSYTFYPGREAARLELTLGRRRTVSAALGQPLVAEGFAISDLVLGYASPSGFLTNPGYPVPRGATIAVRFDVYDIRLDALGLGYLDITLSIIPAQGGSNRGLARILHGPGDPSFVASTFEEQVTTSDWSRTLEIDTGELSTGRYTIRVEVEDTITLARAVRESDVLIVRGSRER